MKTSGDHPNNSNFEIDQNTEKSLGDFRSVAVIQTPVKIHQHRWCEKNLQRVK